MWQRNGQRQTLSNSFYFYKYKLHEFHQSFIDSMKSGCKFWIILIRFGTTEYCQLQLTMLRLCRVASRTNARVKISPRSSHVSKVAQQQRWAQTTSHKAKLPSPSSRSCGPGRFNSFLQQNKLSKNALVRDHVCCYCSDWYIVLGSDFFEISTLST